MRDYTFVDDNGNRCPIAKLATSYIEDCLQHGFIITDNEGLPNAEQLVRERLRIELVARGIGHE